MAVILSTGRPILFVLLICQLFTLCLLTEIIPCSDMTVIGEVNSLNVSGCDTGKCQLVKGENVSMTLTFTIPHQLCNIKVIVGGNVEGLNVDFDAKNSTQVGLPNDCVSPNEEHTVNYVILILPMFPALPNVAVRIYFKGDNDGGIQERGFCVIIPSTLVETRT